MIRDTLTLPDRMISRRATTPGFKLEAAAIVVLGLLGAVGVGLVGLNALDSYQGSEESLRFEFIGGALRPFAGLILLWVGFTVIPHLLSGVYGGRGPVSRLFRGAAWALIPIGLWVALRSAVVYVLFLDVDYSEPPEGFGPSAHYQSFMSRGLDDPIYVAFLLVGVLFAVWSGHLLSKAVQEAKDVSLDDARKLAAIPSGAVALYFVWLALGQAGLV